jgi:pyruvate,water dikinase
LLQGLSVTSSASTRELSSIAAFARERPVARAVIEACEGDVLGDLERIDAELHARLVNYLAVWGLRTLGSDAGTPNVEEKPELFAGLLAGLVEGAPERSPLETRERAIDEAHAALTSPDARQCFDKTLAYAESVYPLREDNVLLTDQMPTGLLRRAGLEFGRRLVERRLLAHREDSAMLTAEELSLALLDTKAASLTSLVQQRKAELLWVRANPGPAVYGAPPGPMPDLRGLPQASRRLNEPLLWEAEQEFGARPQAEAGGLSGLAASSGVHRGKVRVIRSVSELHTLRPGEVLVCPTTSAAWVMLFARAGALVTDAGTVLSHPAIVAREHALPAVVGVAGATSLLKTGEEVIVDGTRGLVTRC